MAPAADLFGTIAARAYALAGRTAPARTSRRGVRVPYLTEAWYCCAEPDRRWSARCDTRSPAVRRRPATRFARSARRQRSWACGWCLPATAATSSRTRGGIRRFRSGSTTRPRRWSSRARAAVGAAPDGILAVGDRPVTLAARVAAALGLPAIRGAASPAATSWRAVARSTAAGLPTPSFHAWGLDEDVAAAVRASCRYPAVVKPLALSGSRGVMRVDDEAGVRRRRFDRLRRILQSLGRRRTSGIPCHDQVLVEAVHPGTRVRGRRRADRRRASSRWRSSTSRTRSTVRSSRRRST